MESSDSAGMSDARFENKKGFHRHSSSDSHSCSTTSAESLSDSSTNTAEMDGYGETESSTQDDENGNRRSDGSFYVQLVRPSQKYQRDVAVKNSRKKYTSVSLSPSKGSESNAPGSSTSNSSQSARPATSPFKSSVTGLPPPPFGEADTPSMTPVTSSKSSATWSAHSTQTKPAPMPLTSTSTHAVPSSSPSHMLRPVKNRIKMLNVDQASTSHVSKVSIIPSATNKSMHDSPPKSPNTPRVFMPWSPSSIPRTPEKSVCESPAIIPGNPVVLEFDIPLQSAMKSPIRASSKIARSITFSVELAQDLETKEVIKKEPSKKECFQAVSKIQAVARGRQGRAKSRSLKRYFSLRKQLDEAEGKKQQELRMIRKELDKKKSDLFERAQARSNLRHNDKSDKVEENQATIQSLRDDNSKMRTQISKMMSACKDLKVENIQMEQSLAVREDYLSKLNSHQDGALEENESLLKVESMFKAKVDEVEANLEIRKQFMSAETNMKMAYRKCMLSAAEMLESGDDESLKDFVSSSVIACMDAEEMIKSASASNKSKDAAKRTVADLGAKPTRRALDTVTEEEEEEKNDGGLDSEPSVESVAASPASPNPSPPSPSPKSPRKPSPTSPQSPKKKIPGTPLSSRKSCIM
jgi:hypothetical protein